MKSKKQLNIKISFGIVECLVIGFLCNKYLDSSNPLGKIFIFLGIFLTIVSIVLLIFGIIYDRQISKLEKELFDKFKKR